MSNMKNKQEIIKGIKELFFTDCAHQEYPLRDIDNKSECHYCEGIKQLNLNKNDLKTIETFILKTLKETILGIIDEDEPYRDIRTKHRNQLKQEQKKKAEELNLI